MTFVNIDDDEIINFPATVIKKGKIYKYYSWYDNIVDRGFKIESALANYPHVIEYDVKGITGIYVSK